MCADGNEAEVGEGINEAITLGLVTRAELWVTSKLWNTYHAAEHVEAAARRSLADLQLEYFDLYLVHFPIALKSVPCPSAPRPGCTLALLDVALQTVARWTVAL